MSKTIRVSAATVRSYVNHASVCTSWKSKIRNNFDLFSADVFDVPVSFIKQGLELADAVLARKIKADFGSALVEANKVNLAQRTALTPDANIMKGVQIAGNSAKNSKLPEAVGKGIYLDGDFDFLVRRTQKGNYLIVPIVKDGAKAPAKFQLLSNVVR